MITCVSIRRLATSLIVALEIVTSHSAEAQETGKPTLPGACCGEAPLDKWTSQEKWVWSKVCVGEIADFNQEPGYGRDLDPQVPQCWPENRILTPEFLETILLHEPFLSAQHRRGVRIVGAWFVAPVELEGAEIKRELWLDNSRLDKGCSLDDARVPLLSLEGSVVGGSLSMRHTEIGILNLHNNAKFAEVDMGSARIGSQLAMAGSTFGERLNMDSISIEGSLFMNGGARFEEVILRAAKIGGQLEMSTSKFGGILNMTSVTVKAHLLMRDKAEFQEVDLTGANIGGQIDMSGSIIAGKLVMNSAVIGGHLIMRAGSEFQDLDLRYAMIAGELAMHGSMFVGAFDLRGATVQGELMLFADQADSAWGPASIFDLRHAKVARFGARLSNSRPGHVRLAGFTYDELGTTADSAGTGESAEKTAEFIEWCLRREEEHSPQAHAQFARVLGQLGFHDQSKRTLFEGKNHELFRETRRGHLIQASWLFVQWAVIGYGHRVWHALLWIGVLVAVGRYIARRSLAKLPGSGEPIGWWYSIDRLLPIVELRKLHYEIDLPKRSRVYFNFHTIMGYVLATFLLAGLSGLVG